MIFYNETQKVWWDMWNILLRIWEWCATNCYNCNSSKDNISFYSYNEFLERIEFINKNCDNKLHLFFYWVEAIFHPEILKFLYDKNLQFFSKSLHITPIYELKRIKTIFELSKKFSNVSFDTCYTIKDNQDLKWVLMFLDFIVKNNIKSTLDLFFDYSKYLPIILAFFKKHNVTFLDKTINTHIWNTKCFEFQLNNSNQTILLYDLKEQVISKSSISNIKYDLCVVKNSLTITDEKIYVSEEVEFAKSGEITVHISTYCSKWIWKISSIYKTKNEIISDFKKLDAYLEKYNTWNMGENCLNCMLNTYNID